MTLQYTLILSSLLLVGCATNTTVSPSQNSTLHTVSPNTATASKGGAMQSSLDSWLQEDWIPNSATGVSTAPVSSSKGAPATSVSTDTTIVTDAKPFTLQTYADKWKAYHEKKEKMNEGKPKEASHIETLQNMPVIGK